jgi:putative peptidoglycan lipid II flippase
MQLPLSIFGISFANVLFPIMSKAVLDKDIQTFKDSLNYTLRMTNFTLFPASIGLMSIGLPLIKILFEHGNFTNMASVMTNQALFYYALGIPAFAGSKLLTNAFYSLHDTKIPIRIAIISMLLHIALCYFLINIMGIKGLALSTSISSYLNLIFLILYLKIKIGKLGLYKIIISASKSLFASIISGFIAWYTIKIKLLMNTSFILTVILSIILSFITFMSISLIIQNEELKNIVKYFHK